MLACATPRFGKRESSSGVARVLCACPRLVTNTVSRAACNIPVHSPSARGSQRDPPRHRPEFFLGKADVRPVGSLLDTVPRTKRAWGQGSEVGNEGGGISGRAEEGPPLLTQ